MGYTFVGISAATITATAIVALSVAYQPKAQAHCQVPCGIYDDTARIARMREDVTTIAKCINNIKDLAGKDEANAVNQATRWVVTKEDHASHIIEVVAQYFLAQKVKSWPQALMDTTHILPELADHHAVIVAAMKAKQSADQNTVATLNAAIDKLATHY